jgi:hypothetical protein
MSLAHDADIGVREQALPPQIAGSGRKRPQRQIGLAGLQLELEMPRIRASGALAVMAVISDGRNLTIPTSVRSRLNWRSDVLASKDTRSRRRPSAVSRSERTCPAISIARAVGCTPRPSRTTNGSAKRTRSRRRIRLTAGWLLSSTCAARVMLPSRNSVSSTRSSPRSISENTRLIMEIITLL